MSVPFVSDDIKAAGQGVAAVGVTRQSIPLRVDSQVE
jgi:hypothetical protein